jgi:hypothetical protein
VHRRLTSVVHFGSTRTFDTSFALSPVANQSIHPQSSLDGIVEPDHRTSEDISLSFAHVTAGCALWHREQRETSIHRA